MMTGFTEFLDPDTVFTTPEHGTDEETGTPMKDLTTVNGFKVVERQPARVAVDDPAVGHLQGAVAGAAIRTVDEVLLENEQVIFQCVHPAAPDCDYTGASPRSVTAHQRSHGGKAVASKAAREVAAAQAEAEAAKAELAARIQRRSDGSKKGAQTRMATKAHAPQEIGGRSGEHGPGRTIVGDTDLARAAQRVITAFNAMQTCADEFQKVLIGYMRMAQTASEAPAIDPQILAKAQQYDVLKAAMNGLSSI